MEASMTQGTEEASSTIALRALRLRPGMFLQLHTGQGQPAVEAKFCAAIENKGVMLVPLENTGPASGWVENLRIEVRGFSGQHDFHFPARVLGNFSIPFAYLLVSYPDKVDARKVRSALRIPTTIPAQTQTGSAGQQAAQVIDLSSAGAMLELQGNGVAVGEELKLAFEIEFERKAYSLQLSGRVCHASGSDSNHRLGVAFSNVGKADRLLLKAYTLAAAQTHGIVD